MSEKNKFFYQGKFFDTEEEFFSYVKEFNERQTTCEDFESLFDTVKKDVWTNLSLYEAKISNKEMCSILQEVFFLILKRFLVEKEGIQNVR